MKVESLQCEQMAWRLRPLGNNHIAFRIDSGLAVNDNAGGASGWTPGLVSKVFVLSNTSPTPFAYLKDLHALIEGLEQVMNTTEQENTKFNEFAKAVRSAYKDHPASEENDMEHSDAIPAN